VDAHVRLDARGIEDPLPLRRNRQHDVVSDQLGPVSVVAVGSSEQARAVCALLKEPIGMLEAAQSAPRNDPRRDREPFATGQYFEPVVEATDHDCADRRHRCCVASSCLEASDPACDCLGDREGLRNREAHGRVDADPCCGNVALAIQRLLPSTPGFSKTDRRRSRRCSHGRTDAGLETLR